MFEREEIEGGSIEYEDSAEPTWNNRRHKSVTASRLAWALVIIFAFAVFGHYLTVVSLHVHGKIDAAEKIGLNFNAIFPVLSSFVGAAVTYYFTREHSD